MHTPVHSHNSSKEDDIDVPEAWMPMRVQTDKQESFEIGENQGGKPSKTVRIEISQ